MRRSKLVLIMILTFTCISSAAFPQGAWDIEYGEIQSLDRTWVGKEIRVDFKSAILDTFSENSYIRNLLQKRDTASIELDGEWRLFSEDWRIYPDHGILREQQLAEIGTKNYIKKMTLISLSDTVITIEVDFHSVYRSLFAEKELVSKQTLIIERDKIKGILFCQ